MTHCLKTWPEYYSLQQAGRKPWELRKNDRDYQIGDTVISQEYDPKTERYTGKESTWIITAILENCPQFGLMDGYCILTLKEKEPGY